ncbi:Aste57867_3964 [Aphanomyces stellatus]|uniref:Aste57867_3964 protein n=1 Tax=Aphanomyces stellatus TaxID=120398 RepID=A0A485KD27_9STRA|nr:hypothetical protein As57867_003953 [Aphanomyces stellatus]VFT81101.1 Aste57867_3964 [Aphanomyces stellatus]
MVWRLALQRGVRVSFHGARARTCAYSTGINSFSNELEQKVNLPFDSNRFITQLQYQGFTTEQAESILDTLKSTMKESLENQDVVLATKSEHVQLKSELTDRVFNSTLKFGMHALLPQVGIASEAHAVDIAQRHMRDLLERDFNNLKQDIRMIEKNDFDKVRAEIVDMEKRFLMQKQLTDRMVHKLQLANETMETMIMKFSVAGGAALVVLIALVGSYFEKS